MQGIVERMGLEAEADGLPRISGRILGYLLLNTEARSLDDLAEGLLISKTSASANARLLERIGAVERVSRPGDRRDYYRVAGDLHVRMMARRMARLGAMRDLVEEALDSEAAGSPDVRHRLETFASFFEHMLDVVREARRRWEGEHDDTTTTTDGHARAVG